MNVLEFMRASVDHPERCEDAVMSFPNTEGRAPVFAMIDGMGGHQRTTDEGELISGQNAALLVRETLIEDLQHLPADVSAEPGGIAEQKALAALQRAHDQIFSQLNLSGKLPLNQRVGAVATVVIVCENGARLLTAQVGDTRAYLLSEGELIQLCYDEDNIEYLVSQGQLSAEDGDRITHILNTFDGVTEPQTEGVVTINGDPYELYLAWRWFVVGNTALKIPASNIVIKCLGIVDEPLTPQRSRIEITPEDRLFMCSDGIYKNLTIAEMTDALLTQENPAESMGEAAYKRSQSNENRRSTQDDISALVVRW